MQSDQEYYDSKFESIKKARGKRWIECFTGYINPEITYQEFITVHGVLNCTEAEFIRFQKDVEVRKRATVDWVDREPWPDEYLETADEAEQRERYFVEVSVYIDRKIDEITEDSVKKKIYSVERIVEWKANELKAIMKSHGHKYLKAGDKIDIKLSYELAEESRKAQAVKAENDKKDSRSL